MKAKAYHIPSKNLHLAVRAALVARGTSLAAWCEDNDVRRPWAMQSLTGKRNGPAAQALRLRIMRDAGLILGDIQLENDDVKDTRSNDAPALHADNGGEAQN